MNSIIPGAGFFVLERLHSSSSTLNDLLYGSVLLLSKLMFPVLLQFCDVGIFAHSSLYWIPDGILLQISQLFLVLLRIPGTLCQNMSFSQWFTINFSDG